MQEEQTVEIIEENQPQKTVFFGINKNKQERIESIRYFLLAFVLATAVFLSQIAYLFQEQLFDWIYYGNITTLLAHALVVVYIVPFIIIFHKLYRRHGGISPFFLKRDQKIHILRRFALYLMAIVPIIVTAMIMKFRFKLEVNLGEGFFQILENAGGMVTTVLRLITAVYFIFLVERGCRKLFTAHRYIPFGGILCAIVFGLAELLLIGGTFAWLNVALYLYVGIVYVVAEERFAVTYVIAVALFLL